MFSLSNFARAVLAVSLMACTACAGLRSGQDDAPQPQVFYTVTAEIALARHEPRVAALQYAAAATSDTDPKFLQRAAEVAAQGLQPSLVADVTRRWLRLDPRSLDAQRAAARAALALHRIDEAAAHYRVLLSNAPLGTEAEFDELENDLTGDENIFGARQVADRLAAFYPASPAALRIAGLTALRADDPASAVKELSLSTQAAGAAATDEAHLELIHTLARARILAGDVDAPLAEASAALKKEDNPANRFEYAVLLMTAQRYTAATEQLTTLAAHKDTKPVALRLMGIVEFQQGHYDVASAKFKLLLRTGKFQDDAYYYLGVMADRNDDPERALRLYAQVRGGENVVPSLLRATTILYKHGSAPAAEELLDRLIEDEPLSAPEIVTTRARMYADNGDLSKAFAVLERGATDYPDSVELRYATASIYEEEGRIPAALQELTLLLKARPDDPAALNALGFTLADHSKNLQEARKLIERAYIAAPKNAAILDSLGWVLYRQGQGAEALPYLKTAYSEDRSGDIGAHLGEVMWGLGQHDEAEKIWTEAGTFDLDNKLLKSTRQRLHAAP